MQHYFLIKIIRLKKLLIICHLFTLNSFSQAADTLGVDIYDALYLIQNNELIKKTPNKSYNYKNIALGDIFSVDIINPMEIVVFYQDFNTVIILDNNLNQKANIPFVDTILFTGKSIVNTIWRYNDTNQKIEQYDYRSQTVRIASQPLTNFTPLGMKSDFNRVELIGKEKTIIFNQYLYISETIQH